MSHGHDSHAHHDAAATNGHGHDHGHADVVTTVTTTVLHIVATGGHGDGHGDLVTTLTTTLLHGAAVVLSEHASNVTTTLCGGVQEDHGASTTGIHGHFTEAIGNPHGPMHKENEDKHAVITKDLVTTFAVWILIWVSGRLAAITKLSPLLFYLLFGAVIGNIHLEYVNIEHSHFMHTLSVLAIAIVFFALGLEENVAHFLDGIKKAWGIASIGALVPFLVGFGCTSLFWPDADINTSLMGGLAVTATAVSLTMISLKSEGLSSSKPAIGIMTSAVLDDIASLAMVAIMVPIATGEASPTIFGIVWTVGKAVLFFVVVSFGHMFIFPNDVREGIAGQIPGLRSVGLQNLLSFNGGEQATLIALTVGMAWSLVAVLFGFHPAIGGYMGGLIMEERYFEVSEEQAQEDHSPAHHGEKIMNTYHEVLHHIETVAYGWLGPFFFVELGATVHIDASVLGLLPYSFGFFIALFIGQFVSAAGAARYVPGGFTWAEAGMIGFGMMGRAELFFVVLDLCYNEHDIMTKEMFVTFALTAMLMNVSVPICISLYKPYYVKHAMPEEDGHGEHPHEEKHVEEATHHGNGKLAEAPPPVKVHDDLDGIKIQINDQPDMEQEHHGFARELRPVPEHAAARPKSTSSLHDFLPTVCGSPCGCMKLTPR